MIGEGISVNVRLIFTVDGTAPRWTPTWPGWKPPRKGGHNLSKIHSVASFFPRVDTEIDDRLENIGTD